MKKIETLSAIVLVLLCMQSVHASENPPPPGERPEFVRLAFTQTLSASELIEWSRRCGAEPADLFYSQEGLSGGYRPADGEDLTEALDRADQLHEEFLLTAMDSNAAALAELAPEKADHRLLSVLQSQMERAFETFNLEGGLEYGEVTVENNPGLVARLIRDGEITSASPLFERPVDTTGIGDGVRATRSGSKSFNNESWAPYRGVSTVTQSSTYQRFYFNDLSAYPSDGTYESETQVYDAAYADYDGYWSSNLPRAYYDTTFLDSSNLDNFTVGSAEATSIITFTEYYTYMSLKAGTASSALVRIKGQRGNRTPAWCYSTWCIFADATTGSMAVFTAPTTNLSWNY